MTLTKRGFRKWCESARISVSRLQERVILARFRSEPYPYEWSEQDISVQIRNYLYCGHWEKPMINNNPDGVSTIPDGEPF